MKMSGEKNTLIKQTRACLFDNFFYILLHFNFDIIKKCAYNGEIIPQYSLLDMPSYCSEEEARNVKNAT